MIPGTGSAFSGCGVCTGAGVCFGAAAMEVEVAAVFRTLGASACGTGCADFLVSLLSHATRNISPAARKTIFKRFTQQLHFNAGLSSSYLLDGSGGRTAASDPKTARDKGFRHCPTNAKKRPRKQPGPQVTLDELPGQAQAELELSGIERCCRRTCLRVLRIHVGDVEPVNEVEHVHQSLQFYPLVKRDGAADPHVGEDGHRPNAGVAARVAVQIAGENAIRRVGIDKARNLECSRRRGLGRNAGEAAGIRRRAHRHRVGPVSGSAEVKVLVSGSHNVIRPARAELDNRRHREVTEELAPEVRAYLAALVNAAKNEAVTLVKRRIRALQVRTQVVLR